MGRAAGKSTGPSGEKTPRTRAKRSAAASRGAATAPAATEAAPPGAGEMAGASEAMAEAVFVHTSGMAKLKAYLRVLGPGFITGASDDDPSGIGAYAQTGAMFGYTQLWSMLLTLPLMTAVQEMCGRIALQSGEGLAALARKHYRRGFLQTVVVLLVFANVLNLGADLGAMAAAGQMLVPMPFLVWLAAITVVSAVLQVFVEYNRYARVLRFLALSLLTYFLVMVVVPQDWAQAVRSTLIPTIRLDRAFLLNLVALLGTTISPYLFFWQAGQEVEEEIDEGRTSLRARHGVTRNELRWMRTDVTLGMVFSNVTSWAIILTTASTLHRAGVTQIESAVQAAEALRPAAGVLTYALFAVGIIGTGLLAVPVLAGSAAYAVAETMKVRGGLYLKLRQARRFYAVIVAATVVGAAINLLGINAIAALYYSAVINGLVAPPMLLLIMLIGNNRQIMGKRVNGRLSNTLGWLTTLLMTLAALALMASFVLGGQ